MSIHWEIKNFPVLKSTQDSLKNHCIKNMSLNEGYVVCAQSQTSGHGRHNRVWSSGDGNLYFSYYLKPFVSCNKIGELSLLAGVCIVRAARKFLSPQFSPVLKWPNDVLIEGGKCSGIIIEANTINNHTVEDVFVGVGVNIKSAPIKGSAAFHEFSDLNLNCTDFLNEYLVVFSELYDEWMRLGFVNIRLEWLRYTYDVGTLISVKIGNLKISGTFDGIDKYGNLILICDESGMRRVVSSGDVFIKSKEN